MPSLPQRKIGDDLVPIPGLGCMGFSAFYAGDRDDDASIEVIKAAYEAGQTFWDTADIYDDKKMGANERLLAKAIKKIGIPRKDLFIATKFGNHRDSNGTWTVIGTPKYVKEACEASLKALEVDTIDLYYQHRVDKNTPIEDTVKAMDELRKAGKVRYLGLSECSAATLRKACKVAKIDALQIEYSLWQTDIEDNGILDACKELDVTLIAYSPLGRGMLAGKFKSRSDLGKDDFRYNQPRFSEENFPKNLQLVTELEKMAKKKGCTPAQLALAWCHQRWEKVIAIPGTTNVDRLRENIESNEVKLTKSEMDQIQEILNTFKPHGDQYEHMGTIGL